MQVAHDGLDELSPQRTLNYFQATKMKPLVISEWLYLYTIPITTLFMVISVTYTICEGPKLDA